MGGCLGCAAWMPVVRQRVVISGLLEICGGRIASCGELGWEIWLALGEVIRTRGLYCRQVVK